jgi:hypothetical protein
MAAGGLFVDRGRQPRARLFELQPPRFTIPLARAAEQTLKRNAADRVKKLSAPGGYFGRSGFSWGCIS